MTQEQYSEMKVNVDELQKTILLLLAKLKESKGNEIEIQADFYWDIPWEELYNPYSTPKDLTLGQLSDDLLEVNKVIESQAVIPYDLIRISNILKALSVENQIAF